LIIDAHVHLYLGEQALDDLIGACDAAGIDKVCLSACGVAFDEPENDGVAAAFRRYPDRVLGFGWVRLGEEGPDAVDRIADHGFAGIKVINPRLPYDHDALMPVYERAEARGLPILFHCGVVARTAMDKEMDVASERMRPVLLDRIARRFPGLKLIGAHLGAPWLDEACAVLHTNPNVWFDCTGVIRRLVARPDSFPGSLLYGSSFRRKWVFGTDCRPAQTAAVAGLHHRLMRRLRLTEAEQAEVMGGRMARILGLA